MEPADVPELRRTHATPEVARRWGAPHPVDPALHGRGIGTEAVRRAIRHLLDERGHHRLTIDPTPANTRAIEIDERLGFRRVGVLRDHEMLPDGEGWRDGLPMDLLAGEESP